MLILGFSKISFNGLMLLTLHLENLLHVWQGHSSIENCSSLFSFIKQSQRIFYCLDNSLRPVKRKWMDIPRQCISVRLADMKKADGVTGEALKEAFELLQKIIFCPLKAVIKVSRSI